MASNPLLMQALRNAVLGPEAGPKPGVLTDPEAMGTMGNEPDTPSPFNISDIKDGVGSIQSMLNTGLSRIRNAPGALDKEAQDTRSAGQQALLKAVTEPRPKRKGYKGKELLGLAGGVLLGKLTGQSDQNLGNALLGYNEARQQGFERDYEQANAEREDRIRVGQLTSQIAEDAASRKEKSAERVRSSVEDADKRVRQEKALTEQRKWELDREKIKNRGDRAKSLEGRYLNANTPGEKRYFGALLQAEADYPDSPVIAPTAEQIAADVRSMGRSALDKYHADVNKFWASAYDIDPGDRKMLDAQRDALINEYGFEPAMIREVPTSKTLTRARMEQSQKQYDQRMELAREKFAFTKDTTKTQLQQGWARVEVARQNARTAMANGFTSTARMILEGSDFKKEVSKLENTYTQKIRVIDAIELPKARKALDAALAEAKNTKAPNIPGIDPALVKANAEAELQKKIGPLQKKVSDLQTERDGWQKLLDEEMATRASLGVPDIAGAYDQAGQLRGQNAPGAGQRPPGLGGTPPGGGGNPPELPPVNPDPSLSPPNPFDNWDAGGPIPSAPIGGQYGAALGKTAAGTGANQPKKAAPAKPKPKGKANKLTDAQIVKKYGLD